MNSDIMRLANILYNTVNYSYRLYTKEPIVY